MTQPADLIHQAVRGDRVAIDRVLKQYTPLVHKIVNKYCFMAPRHSREDLVQEGLIGVVKAIRTFDPERGNRFMTWIYPNVRIAVQGAARKYKQTPKYMLSLEQSDWANNLEDPNVYALRDDLTSDRIREIIIEGCGSIDSKQAKIVCRRFGLLGQSPLRQGEVAREFGLSKQAVQSHLARFHRKMRDKHPELAGMV
jgi:RNA polymerase sporulation-specific sigma factor